MSVFDELEELVCDKIVDDLCNVFAEFTKKLEDEYSVFDNVWKDIEKYENEGVLSVTLENSQSSGNPASNLEDAVLQPPSKSIRNTRQNRKQEDVLSNIVNIVDEGVNKSVRDAQVKIERITNILNQNGDKDGIVVKQEMPPPAKPPVKNKRKGKTQSSTSLAVVKSEVFDNSVIEIPKEPLDVIVLEDSFERSEPVRVTRALRKQRTTRAQPSGDDELQLENVGKPIKVERARTKRKKAKDVEHNKDVDELTASPEKKRTRGRQINKDSSLNQVEVQNNETLLLDQQQTGEEKITNDKTNFAEEGICTPPEKKKPMGRKTNKNLSGKQDEVQNNGTFLVGPEQADDHNASKSKTNFVKEDTSASPQKKKLRGRKINNKSTVNLEVQNGSTFQLEQQQSDTTRRVSKRNSLESPNRSKNEDIESNLQNKKDICYETVTNPVPLQGPSTIDDIMTDDEDFVPESPPITRQGKIIFSPYERSPVKKRVEAFEKLGATNMKITGVTPLKNKLGITSTPIGQISRCQGTPLKYGKWKNLQNTSASKDLRSTNGKQDLTLTSGRTGSALKASQMEFRERQLRIKQKEQEALQKKEAMLLSLAEEKRRKREEREMKVHQIKAAKEKEKQKQLISAEKMKDEKIKQIFAEKEAKHLKLKQEAERKRAAAQKRAAETKQQNVLKKLKANEENQIPVYLTEPAPLLPTPDCYDSDESSMRATFCIPQFLKKNNLKTALHQLSQLELYKRSLFFSGLSTPNLREIFPGIQETKLKRTSSGIWNNTEISILESMREDGEECEEE